MLQLTLHPPTLGLFWVESSYSSMATVTEAVKGSLIGTTVEPQLSQQARATFFKHARQDADGQSYMTEEDFINAIAPETEDYVRFEPFQLELLNY